MARGGIKGGMVHGGRDELNINSPASDSCARIHCASFNNFANSRPVERQPSLN
jgi:hypothetical protein